MTRLTAYSAAKCLLADERLDLAGQGRDRDEHQGVGAEDGAVLLAELGGDGFLSLAGLGGGRRQGLARARSISASTVAGVDEALRNAEPFGVQHEGRADGDTGRDGDAAFDFHADSDGQANSRPDESGPRQTVCESSAYLESVAVGSRPRPAVGQNRHQGVEGLLGVGAVTSTVSSVPAGAARIASGPGTLAVRALRSLASHLDLALKLRRRPGRTPPWAACESPAGW